MNSYHYYHCFYSNEYSVPKITFILDESFDKAESLDKALEREESQIESLKKDA